MKNQSGKAEEWRKELWKYRYRFRDDVGYREVEEFIHSLLSRQQKETRVLASNTIAGQMVEYVNTPLKERKDPYEELYKARRRVESVLAVIGGEQL